MISKDFICFKSETLLAALKRINNNAKGIVFVVNSEEKLAGVLTDGDIRRALLDGISLDENIENIINKDFVYANKNDSTEETMNKVNSKIKIMPIVNDDMVVVDFFEINSSIYTPVAEPYLKGNEVKYVTDALLSTWISSSGKYITQFEEKFADYCGCEYGVATSNGTTALHLALLALGVGEGDEVIIPDLTFAATINAVLHANATPVIVDVENDSWCIDPNEIKKAITPRTKAIIPVHIYGQPCDMDAIMKISQEHNLYVIEDCAEAHGAEVNGKKVGSFGHINCFSFFANKIITSGEGGMCLTNSKELNDRLRVLRDHGMNKSKKYWHDVVGYNYRMTNIQAAIGLAQLERIQDLLDQREELENKYYNILNDVNFIEFQDRNLPNRKKVTWLISILITDGNRDIYINKLSENNIDVRPFFYPLSAMDLYKKYVYSNNNSLKISKCGINLPTLINLDNKIIESIRTILIGEIQ